MTNNLIFDDLCVTFSERNELSMAYNRWLMETNEAHRDEYELKDNALQVINFLCSRGLLKIDEVKAFVEPTMKKGK
ncbi:MAG: hypothetical protein IKN43_14535 [Selenomonadaceae bacterium]|nr:hypothetical protein [Selenomonadaceae bacterium]